MSTHLELTHRTNAHGNFATIRSQLNAVSGFIARRTLVCPKDQPYTFQSLRVLQKFALATIESLNKADAALHVGPEERAPDCKIETPEELVGLVEFALILTGKAIQPMKLNLLPPGTPGTKEFEEPFKQRSGFYRAVSEFIQVLGDFHNALRSDIHSFQILEAERGSRYRAAKKKFLSVEIAARSKDIADAEGFLTECRAVLKKLTDELANVDQSELSGLFEEESDAFNSAT